MMIALAVIVVPIGLLVLILGVEALLVWWHGGPVEDPWAFGQPRVWRNPKARGDGSRH